MGKKENTILISEEIIISKIYQIRGKHVMLSQDLAIIPGRNEGIKPTSQAKYR